MKMMFSCIHFPIWPYPLKIMEKNVFYTGKLYGLTGMHLSHLWCPRNCNINFFDMLTRWLTGQPDTDHYTEPGDWWPAQHWSLHRTRWLTGQPNTEPGDWLAGPTQNQVTDWPARYWSLNRTRWLMAGPTLITTQNQVTDWPAQHRTRWLTGRPNTDYYTEPGDWLAGPTLITTQNQVTDWPAQHWSLHRTRWLTGRPNTNHYTEPV